MKKIITVILSVCLVAAIASSVSAAYTLTDYTVPANGVHFSFDNKYSTDDGSLTATPKGAVSFITDRNGKDYGAVYFQAGDQHLELLKKDYNGDWSVSAWILTVDNGEVDTQNPSYYSRLLISQNAAINTISNNSSTTPKCPGVWVSGQKNLALDHTGHTGKNGEWYMFTMTYKANSGPSDHELKFYIDGKDVTRYDVAALSTTAMWTAAIPLPLTLIGNDSASLLNTQMDQRTAIDDLWIFGKTLTADEVAKLYTNNTLGSGSGSSGGSTVSPTTSDGTVVVSAAAAVAVIGAAAVVFGRRSRKED